MARKKGAVGKRYTAEEKQQIMSAARGMEGTQAEIADQLGIALATYRRWLANDVAEVPSASLPTTREPKGSNRPMAAVVLAVGCPRCGQAIKVENGGLA